MKQYLFLGLLFLLLLFLENIFPLRLRRDIFPQRFLKNLALGALALPITRIIAIPLVYSVAAKNAVGGPLLQIVSFVFLDYCIYWWHVALHRIEFLWRFHQVHHSDKDMDASTALRFHFGELLLSAFPRLIIIFFTGIGLEILIAFDVLVSAFSIFHHSNLKLPSKIEHVLSIMIVTPLYHQTHHSFYLNETNSNYATIFSFWDRVHKTKRRLFDPLEIKIGIPYFENAFLSLKSLFFMPEILINKWPLEYKKRKLAK